MKAVVIAILVALLPLENALAQTWEQYNDPAFWVNKHRAVQSRDNRYGMTLPERAAECQRQSMRVAEEAERAGGFLISFHLLASPSRGYITPAAATQDQRQIGTYSTVAYRDIRTEKHDGADVEECTTIADHAVARIRGVLSKYPTFDQYDPNASVVYR